MNRPLELTVMMYHYVRDPGDDAEAGSGITGMSVKAFETQLDNLSKQHNFVTWSDVRMGLQEDKPLPGSACLLTFDDGVLDHYVNVFRILQCDMTPLNPVESFTYIPYIYRDNRHLACKRLLDNVRRSFMQRSQ